MSVAITGMGLVGSIGNSCAEALVSLREARTGIAIHPQLAAANAPCQLAGTLSGFSFPDGNPANWEWPEHVQIPRAELRSLPPHGVFARVALAEALTQAGLSPQHLRDPGTGLLTSSAGSNMLLHAGTTQMIGHGVRSISPFSVTSSTSGTLTFNLAASLGITGSTGGCVAACASSALAIGHAADQIRLGRQHTMIVVGAEDDDILTCLPFASMRALTTSRDPQASPCAFDIARDGFAPTGGAAVLVLEDATRARKRGAQILAEMRGWGWASDGHHPIAPEPEGKGLERTIRLALEDAGLSPAEIHHINAHAPSTMAGDLAEAKALLRVFGKGGPPVSATKSQTGHALSMAGALEAVISVLSLHNGLIPANVNLRNPDPGTTGLNLPTQPREMGIETVLSNSSGFGGTNVALVFGRHPKRLEL